MLLNKKVLANAIAQNNEYALVEFDDMQPYLKEANNLIALRRYKEAEVLLRPVFILDKVENFSPLALWSHMRRAMRFLPAAYLGPA